MSGAQGGWAVEGAASGTDTYAVGGRADGWSGQGQPSGEAGTPGFALDALAGLGAAAFAALMLWSLPAFLGLPDGATTGLPVAAGGALGYVIAGPHGGTRRLRTAVPLVTVAALLGTVAVFALVPGGLAAMGGLGAQVVGQLAGWSASGALPAPSSSIIAAAAGLCVGLPVFHAARAGRPSLALLLGFALLVIEWEFVDDATVRLFWPLVLIALFWLAADRARETACVAEMDIGSPTPWVAFGMAGLAGLVVFGTLLLVPRHGGPANLGGVGVWIDHLPLVGPLEKATREGSLGYPSGGGGGPGAGSGSGTGAGLGTRTGGFDLAQTGFGGTTTELGGPVHVDNGVALSMTVAGSPAPPAVLYLRGTVRSLFDGSGWLVAPGAEAAEPTWPAANAGDVGRAFVAGSGIPAPFRLLNARITLQAATSANLFTVLSPLRLSAPVTWDTSGQVWVAAPPPAGFAYTLTSGVLPSDLYKTTDFAPYLAAGLPPGRTISPEDALRLATNGIRVEPAPVQGLPRGVGDLPPAADLQVPSGLLPRDKVLARVWTRGITDPLLMALAIQQHLLAYQYSLSPPPTPTGRDFVDYFLFGARRGYCTYYSSAMAVLLRTVGVPTRWVEGFRTSVPASGGTFLVRNAAAHAWVEAYIAPYGWLTFDPTPAAIPPPTVVGTAVRPKVGGHHLALPHYLWIAVFAPIAFVLLLGISALGNLLAERQAEAVPTLEAQVVWRACERVGARFGRRRHRDETPAEYAREISGAFPALAGAAEHLAAAYGRLRYGPPLPEGGGGAELQRLRDAWAGVQAAWRSVSPLTYTWRRWV